MISLCFFNNKGGVGKTTLACNVASYLGRERRVLLVDGDPQCNATQLILGDDVVTALYTDNSNQQTLVDVLEPIRYGEASIAARVTPILASTNRFRVDVLPGHPRMSLVEDRLSLEWGNVMQGDVGGIRKTNWVKQLLDATAPQYDFVVFDLGPSLGALNRTVLIGVEFFITPMGSDIFSIMGIKNISEWLGEWSETYARGIRYAEEKEPQALARYDISSQTGRRCRFLGYTIQQYITKTIRGRRRPTTAYERILRETPLAVSASLHDFVAPGLAEEDLKLGDIPHLYSLVPLAQSANAPIHALRGSDALVGSQFQQQRAYVERMTSVIEHLASNIGKVSTP